MEIRPIAYVRNGFPTKFGLPRQSGLVEALESVIVFEKEYAVPEALRGLEGYSHLWLIWGFHQAGDPQSWSPTVRPPRLGGNTRVGVFATRSPFRPNRLGMSCVRLLRVEKTREHGDVLVVAGTDMMDGTPVYDIKPYVPLTDCRPDATGGFTDTHEKRTVRVEIPEDVLEKIPAGEREAVRALLREDPRPAYQEDPERIYGFPYAGMELRFRVADGVLTVLSAEEA